MSNDQVKFFANSRYDNVCSVCADELPKGCNILLYKGAAACPHHSFEDVIASVDDKQVEMRAEAPKNPADALGKDAAYIDLLVQQNRILEAMKTELLKLNDVGIKLRESSIVTVRQ